MFKDDLVLNKNVFNGKRVKASELATKLIEHISKNGDTDIIIDILSENQSNYVNCTSLEIMDGIFQIECDIDNVKEFKKKLK